MRATSALVLALSALAPSPLRAEPSAADKETARAQLTVGDGAFRNKDYASALNAYSAADAIMHVPTTSLEVARALEALGQWVEARDKYLQTSRMAAGPDEPAPFAVARDRAREAASSLLPRIPSLTVSLGGAPAVTAVEAFVDNVALNSALFGIPRKVNPGRHVVRFVVARKPQDEREVTLTEGGAATVEFTPDKTGPLQTMTGPDATRGVDSRGERFPIWASAGLVVGAVGIGVGSITGILSLSRAGSAKDHCVGNDCARIAEADIDAAKTLSVVSTISFAIGLAGAGAGIAGWLLPRGRGASGTSVSPIVGAGTAGIEGRF